MGGTACRPTIGWKNSKKSDVGGGRRNRTVDLGVMNPSLLPTPPSAPRPRRDLRRRGSSIPQSDFWVSKIAAGSGLSYPAKIAYDTSDTLRAIIHSVLFIPLRFSAVGLIGKTDATFIHRCWTVDIFLTSSETSERS